MCLQYFALFSHLSVVLEDICQIFTKMYVIHPANQTDGHTSYRAQTSSTSPECVCATARNAPRCCANGSIWHFDAGRGFVAVSMPCEQLHPQPAFAHPSSTGFTHLLPLSTAFARAPRPSRNASLPLPASEQLVAPCRTTWVPAGGRGSAQATAAGIAAKLVSSQRMLSVALLVRFSSPFSYHPHLPTVAMPLPLPPPSTSADSLFLLFCAA